MPDSTEPTIHAGGTRRFEPPPPDAPTNPADVFGNFVRIAKLGAGGGGEVWRAWDTKLRRWVALKLLRVGTDGDADDIARFKREAQTAGALSHPHIAAIYEVGEASNRPYIAMQLIEGSTLRGLGRLNHRMAARLVRDAALAIDYAHQLGIVHRDLKPENLMVARAAGGPPDEPGHVYVMDFGLARAVDHPSVTVSGSILGTPAYMSPEQARGRISEIGVRSDIWSLGATLYDLLTGKPPFAGDTPWDIVMKVTQEDPPPPAGLERDLRTIVMKCLEKEPSQRYDSARALADDLGRWLAGEPILAHPPSILYRARKRAAKHKWALLAALAVLAVLAPVILLARSGQGRAERAVRLWSEITGVLATAGEARRSGDLAGFRARLDHGIALCSEHIRRDDHPHAHFFLGRLLRFSGKSTEAEAALTRALELDPTLAECRFERGVVRAIRYLGTTTDRMARPLVESQYGLSKTVDVEAADPALTTLRRGAEEDLSIPVGASPFLRDLDAVYGRGLLAQARGELAEAVRLFESILERDPRHTSAMLNIAEIAYDRGEFEEVRRRATEVLAIDRGFVEAARRRAMAILAGRIEAHYPTALADIDRFMANEAPLGNDHVVRALLLRRLDRVPEAIEALGRALALEPKNPYALNARARLYQLAGNLDAAEADIDAALRVSPDFGTAHITKASVRLARKDTDGALAAFEKAESLLPRFVPLYTERAKVLWNAGKQEAALKDLNRAIDLKPDDLESLNLRALYNRALRRLDAALADVEAALRIDKNSFSALNNRAWLHIDRREFAEAIPHFDRMIELQPKSVDGWGGRGMVRYLQGQNLAALEDFDAAGRCPGATTDVPYMRGLILRRLDRTKEAIAAFDQAITMEPGHVGALAERGYAKHTIDDVKGARQDYDAVLKLDPRQPDTLLRRATLRANEGDRFGALVDVEASLKYARANWPLRARAEQLKKELQE